MSGGTAAVFGCCSVDSIVRKNREIKSIVVVLILIQNKKVLKNISCNLKIDWAHD